MRISRPCYDGFWRCPGWVGGGLRSAKVTRCVGGSLPLAGSKRAWRWRFNQCPRCGVIVLPYNVRLLDPGWWKWRLPRLLPVRYRDWLEERRHPW